MRKPALVYALLVWLAAAGSFAAHAEGRAPQPFVAKYAVTYRGMSAGTLTFRLSRDAASGRYVYETSAAPSFLARLVVSSSALERSEMEIDADGVRPIRWQLDDGKTGDERDGLLTFDWDHGLVSGTIEREKINLPTQPGLQDRLSIQIAMVVALLRGAEPGTIPLIDDNRIKRYTYTRHETGTMETPLGKLDTVLYESTREGSNRVSRFWLVPELEYVAARAEQVRKGKVETVMVLTALERSPQ